METKKFLTEIVDIEDCIKALEKSRYNIVSVVYKPTKYNNGLNKMLGEIESLIKLYKKELQ